MDCFFRYALAAGFLALPLSLAAAEKGSSSGGNHPQGAGLENSRRQPMEAKLKEHKHPRPPLTQEQKEKIKAAMLLREQKRKEHHQEMQAKLQEHKQEMQAKLANGKENHHQEKPWGQSGQPGHRHLPAAKRKVDLAGHGGGHQ